MNTEHLGYKEATFVHKALSEPLQFGNPDQIKALKLAEPPPLEEGKTKRYRVTVEFSGDYHEYVDANSEEEAKSKVSENIGFMPDGVEVEIRAKLILEDK